MDNGLKYISKSSEATFQLGETIGELVEPGQLILISGELGAGKTLLTQGISAGLNVDDDVTSPSYNLINEYEGELPLFHMDLYRLDDEEDLYNLGFEEYLDRDGVVVIEWPDLAYDLIPVDFLFVKISILDDQTREILFEAEGNRGIKLIKRLGKNVGIRD